MGVKEFLIPNKSKIILFIIILVLGLLSNGFKVSCFGNCDLSSTQKLLDNLPRITSPGLNALIGDNGFFMNYKARGTFSMVLEGAFHLLTDLVYWYLLSCIIIYLSTKIRRN